MRNPFKNRDKGATKPQEERACPTEDTTLVRTSIADADIDSQLDAAFERAASRLESSVGSADIDQDDLLTLYGLYKQATSGPCTTFRPPFFDLKARSKWAAWKNLEEMPPEQAKIIYTETVTRIFPGAENGQAGGMGPVVSRLANDASDDDADVPEWDSLHIRASQGDVAGVEKLLEEGAEVNARDSDGCCPLHWACDRGSTPMVKLLLQKGADPKLCDLDGQSAREYAAISGHAKVMQLLDSLGVG